jgi:hypothetical protein
LPLHSLEDGFIFAAGIAANNLIMKSIWSLSSGESLSYTARKRLEESWGLSRAWKVKKRISRSVQKDLSCTYLSCSLTFVRE